MQFKVPQNVQMEDKIVGPLTLKQLIICAVGGGISYFIYISTSNIYVLSIWLPATSIPALITVAIAFVKIKDIPFIKFVFLELERLLVPQKRFFIKGSAETYKSCLYQEQTKKQIKKEADNIKKKNEAVKGKIKDIDKLTKILDSQGVTK
ncbi:MAG: hypothetical protein UV80_C0011G0020 [Candidatus Peregrinibacteria bacterium GW2011_GWF2_43_17]|nr:MAG: hypothetical protein UV80_C0011G0020 [Candidatus Peregrinibacteria bacterium GW2011_GWF2_43_17]KKT19157.1 MAG: hypothetical protein UW03_C0023G0011 [Candidatus Peregrinibacteria bacterium GW2011_GWA2_43_8]HAU39963.1 hypothetical protein [Candidatus Peregrinibacteria bacterium]